MYKYYDAIILIFVNIRKIEGTIWDLENIRVNIFIAKPSSHNIITSNITGILSKVKHNSSVLCHTTNNINCHNITGIINVN